MSGFTAEYYNNYSNAIYVTPIEADSLEQATEIAERYITADIELVNITQIASR